MLEIWKFLLEVKFAKMPWKCIEGKFSFHAAKEDLDLFIEPGADTA